MSRRRWSSVVVALVGLLLVGVGGARADEVAVLSGVRVEPGHVVSGVLTVSAAADGAHVDVSSLRLSVAGKSYPVSTQPVAARHRATMLVIDTSGSMGSSGMATVRSAASAFLKTAPADVQVGLVSFAGSAVLQVPPTTDRAAVQAAVDRLRSTGETTLFDAVASAVDALAGAQDRAMIVLSDGADTRSVTSRAQAGAALRDSGVRAQIIGFRTASGDDIVLSELAAAGRGSVVPAADNDAVTRIFAASARALDAQVSWSATLDGAVAGSHTLVMSGQAHGTAFSTSTPVDVGAALAPSPAPAPSASAPVARATIPATTAASGGPAVGLVLAGAATFVGVAALAILLMSLPGDSSRSERVASIEQYVGRQLPGPTVSPGKGSGGLAQQLVDLGDRAVRGRESTSRTMVLLARADLPWKAGEWAVLRAIAGVVGLCLGYAFLGGGLASLFGGAVGLLVGIVGPPVILRQLAARRARRFERQLPDVLTLVASSLSTGFSLLQALDAVSRDVEQPAAKEFSRAMAETRIGSDVEEALERMAERMGSKNMRWTAMAIGIQRQVGGNLAETLRTTTATLRDREALFRHVRALSAEGRLSAYILIALPVVIFLWMLRTSPEYISVLWSSLVGVVVMVVMVFIMAVGIFWMRKVVEVDA